MSNWGIDTSETFDIFSRDVDDMVDAYVMENFKEVTAGDIGIDPRCGRAYVNSECVAVPKYAVNIFNYYGGFEYIREGVKHMGNYTFYPRDEDSGRVSECIDFWEQSQSENN